MAGGGGRPRADPEPPPPEDLGEPLGDRGLPHRLGLMPPELDVTGHAAGSFSSFFCSLKNHFNP